MSFNGITYSHTLVVIKPGRTIEDSLIAANTFDTFGKRVLEYSFDLYRCVNIV